ncbi:MAG: hypothetical protein ACFFED_18770 [Candidatus Thorarchaeota archaeon]
MKEDVVNTDEGDECESEDLRLTDREAKIVVSAMIFSFIGFIWIMNRIQSAIFSEFGPSPADFAPEDVWIMILGVFVGMMVGVWFGVGLLLGTKITPNWSTNAKRIIVVGSVFMLLGASLLDIILDFWIGMIVIIVGVVMVFIPAVHQRIVKGIIDENELV